MVYVQLRLIAGNISMILNSYLMPYQLCTGFLDLICWIIAPPVYYFYLLVG